MTLNCHYGVNAIRARGIHTTNGAAHFQRKRYRAYVERVFAMKTLGKYFRTGDRAVLEKTYEAVIKSAFSPFTNGRPKPRAGVI